MANTYPTHHPFRSFASKEKYLSHYDQRARAWPVGSETQEIETKFGKTFVRISGANQAPPLVLLPGINATSLMWIPNIEGLSKNFRVFALDNIYDFGRSVYSRPMRKPADFAEWLEELVDKISPHQPAHLMGISYGGWIASQYALRNPTRLGKLILVAPAMTVVPISIEFILRAISSAIPIRFFARSFIYWLASSSIQKDVKTRALIDQMVEDGFLGVQCFAPKRTIQPTLLSDLELQSLSMPTLYVVGNQEKLFSPAAAIDRLSRVAKNIETRVLVDTGHDLTIAQAELFNQIVTHFLSSSNPHR